MAVCPDQITGYPCRKRRLLANIPPLTPRPTFRTRPSVGPSISTNTHDHDDIPRPERVHASPFHMNIEPRNTYPIQLRPQPRPQVPQYWPQRVQPTRQMPTAYHESQYHGPPSQPNRQVNKCKVVRKLSDNTWIEMYVPWDGHSLEQASYAIKNFAESLEKSSTQKPCRCHKQRSADPPQETCPQPQAFKRSSPEPQPFTRSPYQPKAPRNSLPQPQSFTGGPPQPNTARVSRELSPPQTQLRKGSPLQPDTDQYSTHQPQPLTGIPHQPQIDHYGPLELQAPNYTAPQYPLPPKTNPLPPARSKFTFTEENHQVICSICQAPAESSHLNYGAYSCFSCRAFFRRSVQMELYPKFSCQYERQCEITIGNRNFCRCCRFEKCQKMGMKISAVLSLEQKRTRFRKYLGLRRMDEMNKSAEMKVALRSFRKKPSAVHEKDALLNEDST